MLGAAAPYLVAISAIALAGLSALTLICAVRHLDPPEPQSSESASNQHIAVS